MAEIGSDIHPPSRAWLYWGGGAASLALFTLGAGGALTEAWGYGLLLASALLLLGSTVLFSVFIFSHRFETAALKAGFVRLFLLGAALYVIAAAALGGYYFHEALAGRIELKWILFGPAILAAVIVLDLGLYRVLIGKNLPAYRRYGGVVTREAGDPAAMRRTLIDEVVLQKSLFSVSRLRWLRHTLIFWGFTLLFATELFAVLFREILTAFGWSGLWAEGHPLRIGFDLAFEVFGLAVLLGCLLAFLWRWLARGTAEEKFHDTPTAIFLFAVVSSGFLVEALRIGIATPDPLLAVSFVGYALAVALNLGAGAHDTLYEPLWWLHVFGSCLFIAYVPVKRLIHSCATPMGRLMNSQKGLLEAKRRASISGLFQVRKRDTKGP
jgi:nitrate reductase gamma subunit